jgi:hypothetical protein
MAGVCCLKRVLTGWDFDETFGRWGGRKPPEDHRSGLAHRSAALGGFCEVGFLMKPSGGAAVGGETFGRWGGGRWEVV